VDNTILIATGFIEPTESKEEFTLYSYNMKAKKLTLLASSGRKTKETPFDNLKKPIEAKGMIADPERGRILMAIDGFNIPGKLSGIWEYRLQERTWHRFPGTNVGIEYFSLKNGTMLVEGDFSKCYRFEPEKNSMELVYSYRKSKRHKSPFPELNGSASRLSPPYLLTSRYFWAAGGFSGTDLGFGRISLADGVFEKLLTINSRGRYLYINITEDGKYLITADHHNVYLMRLQDEK